MTQHLDDLDLYLQAAFMPLVGHEAYVSSDFYISRYPVSVRDFSELIEKTTDISEEDSKFVKMATWSDAIQYCNQLSRSFGLPVSYNEVGYLINPVGQPVRDITEVMGFRLPTPQEWGYAAMGGMKNGRMDDWQAILENPYYQEMGSGKTLEIEKLGLNTIGLSGMIGNVQEWCSDCDYSREVRNQICEWSYYYSNYDVMSYNIRTDFLDRKDRDVYASRFRLVFPKAGA